MTFAKEGRREMEEVRIALMLAKPLNNMKLWLLLLNLLLKRLLKLLLLKLKLLLLKLLLLQLLQQPQQHLL